MVRFVREYLSPLPRFWRFHQLARCMLVPFLGLIDFVPEREGPQHHPVLLDVGCGHGVFLGLLRKERPDYELIGIDLSAGKVAAARLAFSASNLPAPEIIQGKFSDFPIGPVDVVTIIDMMYLVPLERWDRILQKAYDCLRPGGRLLLKAMDRRIRWKFALLYAEETLAVRVLGLTLGESFTFPDPEDVRRRVERVGFTVERVPLDRGYYVPHLLWVCTKPGGDATVSSHRV
jgi:cyclopropane fatty-acyl-phospholipid synthase-like methyltransferase